MIGQEKLLAKLKSYDLSTLPHSILLTGEAGCGKHTLAKELAGYFHMELKDITDSVTLETLSDIRMRAVPAMYLISATDLTEKEQNALLKFVEEPSPYAYILILGESRYALLDTLVNRCVEYAFDRYTAEDLKSFLGEDVAKADEIVGVCTTPGQVRAVVGNYDKMVAAAAGMADKDVFQRATFSNLLNFVDNKINYKDEYDKFDFTIYLRLLKREMMKYYSRTKSPLTYSLYNKVEEYTDRLSDSRLDKKVFMEHLITTMWIMVREAA